jgi:hypothetical protein
MYVPHSSLLLHLHQAPPSPPARHCLAGCVLPTAAAPASCNCPAALLVQAVCGAPTILGDIYAGALLTLEVFALYLPGQWLGQNLLGLPPSSSLTCGCHSCHALSDMALTAVLTLTEPPPTALFCLLSSTSRSNVLRLLLSELE